MRSGLRARLQRVAITAALAVAAPAIADPAEPAAAGEPAAEPRPSPSMSAAPDMRSRELPRFDDRSKVGLPPLVIPQQPPAADRRPIFIGAGLVVLGLVFWWNRRRRDRFDREDDPAQPVRARRERRRPRDDDADDLHAAARGDDPDASERPDPP